ncbi:MAG: SgcJ/EcaC family oxidoreductase [Phycisphaerae bacterium]|nr:SgcJ/EcaC family oxidoreductase [Saprospiraceae bacterium]
MKNFLFNLIAFCAFALSTQTLQAQSTSKDEAAILKMWDAVWQAYESGDEAKMWSFYADNACEIYPDGSSLCGIKAIREGYEMFKTMMEGTPSWTMTKPTVTFLGSEVALLMSDVTADIKLKGGQQIGGPSKFATILHKVKGQWLIAFDSQTPVIPMPDAGK